MSLFRRRPTPSPIAAFWEWWGNEGEELFAQAESPGRLEKVVKQVNARVDAIHPELQWETSAGITADQTLCVTGGGIPELRPIAERWLRSAPPANSEWEFAAARRRDAHLMDAQLGFAGSTLDLALTRATIDVDDDRLVVDVCIYHPAFAEVPREAAQQATFLILDWLLGEDDVERWIAGIDCVSVDPASSMPIIAVRETVDAMATRHVDPVWIVLEATTSQGDRALITAMRPLRWIDHPLLDLHSEIHVPFASRRDDGLPTTEALDYLREYEDEFVDEMGVRGMLLAHETFDGQRVFHVYTDSEDQNARNIIDGFRPEDGTCEHALDPSWKHMRPFAER